jgi:hypothetical protein
MNFFRRLTGGEIAALLTVTLVAGLMVSKGQGMFSPGPLADRSRTGAKTGGVSSHAALETNCAACHASPLNGQTMASRCMDCHTNVRQQLDSHGPIHGMMTNGLECRTCHTEHHGTQAAITNLTMFNHDWAAFKLTGAHGKVECASCHKTGVYQGTAQACVSCHAEPAVPTVHKAKYGTTCIQCHSTTTFKGATFNHNFFSINHGGRRTTNTCATCHADEQHFAVYTCYNCHEHTPAKMAQTHLRRNITNYQDCISCHARKGTRRVAELDSEPADAVCALEAAPEAGVPRLVARLLGKN